MKTKNSVNLACLLAVALMVPLAHASVLGVGGTAPPTALTPSASSTLLASIIGGTIAPFPVSDFTVTYSTWVYSDPTNNFCIGCLDFVYQFTNNGPSVNERYSMGSFSGFQVDAGTSPFGMHDPNTVDRSFSGNGPTVGFNFDQFGNEIVSGETTVQLVIETDARYFTNGLVSAQNSTAGSNIAFQPAAVPEPTTLALMGGGLSVFGLLLRKFKVVK